MSLHQKQQSKFLVCVNLLSNKAFWFWQIGSCFLLFALADASGAPLRRISSNLRSSMPITSIYQIYGMFVKRSAAQAFLNKTAAADCRVSVEHSQSLFCANLWTYLGTQTKSQAVSLTAISVMFSNDASWAEAGYRKRVQAPDLGPYQKHFLYRPST